MALRIEDYGLIGDTHTAALIGRNGSIDWLCLPRFDSGACFAALLGEARHGRWCLSPRGPVDRVVRRYRGATLILETEFHTPTGVVRLVDFMTPRDVDADVVRIVEGVRGEVPMTMDLTIRFDYGSVVPWVRRVGDATRAIAGPDALTLWPGVATHGRGLSTIAEFTVHERERIPFVVAWHRSYEEPAARVEAFAALAETESWWQQWTSHMSYGGDYREAVLRSLCVLKALTYAPTGGIVAAPTTSLPEHLGGVRNWDYRFCWLRDATFTLTSLIAAGYRDEAAAWRDWLLRSVAGDPSRLQILYGVAGERRLREHEIEWLPGYEGSRPVRVGNDAVGQIQLDVYGEIMDAMHHARRAGLRSDDYAWQVQRAMLEFLESNWEQPDEGIWEVRGPRRHFVHSKVLAWVAFDRAVKAVEQSGLAGPVERWRAQREAIHREVLERGYDSGRATFTQFYGSRQLDASLLQIPLVGFLPPNDPRVIGTVRAVERELMHHGVVMRYSPEDAAEVDGLPGGEGAFLACSFWLVDNYYLQGRHAEARALFERLLALRNDLGLLAEEYDPVARRQLGNFPQAFSHLALVDAAFNLSAADIGPAELRRAG